MGALAQELAGEADGEVMELSANFRSTPRIMDISNGWNRTITPPPVLTSPDMRHGRVGRTDFAPSHVAAAVFPDRASEAAWIAETVRSLVPGASVGARHDTLTGDRGLTLSD